MKDASKKPDLNQLISTAKLKFVRYRVVIFVVFVGLIYSYVFFQINNFNNAKPSAQAISNQEQASPGIPRIDPTTVSKIEQLKDNSVNVQALFNQSRNNPFSS